MLIAFIAEFSDKMSNVPLTESETWLWVIYTKREAEMGLKSRITTHR